MLQSILKGLRSLVPGRGESNLSPEEKRNLIRVRCRLPVTVTEEGHSDCQATVTDISLNGLRVKLDRVPSGGQLFITHPRQGIDYEIETVRTQVVWTRKRRTSTDVVAGLKFTENPENLAKSWVRFILRSIGLDERAIYQRRRYIRAESLLPAALHDPETGRNVADGHAINLGLGGMLFKTLDPLERDTPVRVVVGPRYGLKPLDLPGTVLGNMEDPEGRFHHYSVRFNSPEGAQLANLGKFVIALLHETSELYGRQNG